MKTLTTVCMFLMATTYLTACGISPTDLNTDSQQKLTVHSSTSLQLKEVKKTESLQPFHTQEMNSLQPLTPLTQKQKLKTQKPLVQQLANPLEGVQQVVDGRNANVCTGYTYQTCQVDYDCGPSQHCTFPKQLCVSSYCHCNAQTGRVECTMDCLTGLGTCQPN